MVELISLFNNFFGRSVYENKSFDPNQLNAEKSYYDGTKLDHEDLEDSSKKTLETNNSHNLEILKNKFDSYNNCSFITEIIKKSLQEKPKLLKKSIFYSEKISQSDIKTTSICISVLFVIFSILFKHYWFVFASIGLAQIGYSGLIIWNKMLLERNEYVKKRYCLKTKEDIDNFDYKFFNKKMYDEFSRKQDDPNKPNALVLLPKSDYNGAFLGSFHHLMIPFLGDHNIDVFFPTSIDEINTFLKTKKYKQVIFAGHGTKNTTRFTNKFCLKTKDIKLLDFSNLEKEAELVFESCCTGKKDGIAQKVAEVAKRKVFAPKENSYGVFIDTKEGVTNYKFFSKSSDNITQVFCPI